MKHTKHYLNQNAKYFGGEKHGQVSNITIKDALLEPNTLALQEIFHLNGEQVKVIYVAFVEDKEEYYQDAINDFEKLLKDVKPLDIMHK
jgi:hypothetical protein